jgi:hypothetical protein
LGFREYISKNMGGIISDFDEFEDVIWFPTIYALVVSFFIYIFGRLMANAFWDLEVVVVSGKYGIWMLRFKRTRLIEGMIAMHMIPFQGMKKWSLVKLQV